MILIELKGKYWVLSPIYQTSLKLQICKTWLVTEKPEFVEW